jgi:multicomponent Na+:H+ antiporter subunit D
MNAIPLLVVLPLAAAAGLGLLAPFVERRAGLGALLATGTALALALVVLGDVGPVRRVVWLGGWEPVRGTPIGIALVADPASAAFAVLVATLAVISSVLAARLVGHADRLYDAVVLVFVAGMLGFCLSGDLFTLFVFLEVMSVAGFVLVGFEVRRQAPLQGAMNFAVTNATGAILVVFGIGLIYGRTGALNLAAIGRALDAAPLDAATVAGFSLIATGLLVKAAAVPFHFWLADAYAVAPTPVCILLAGAFAELGLYGLARIYWTAFAGAFEGGEEALRAILVSLGAITALVGAVLCAAQHHLKRLLAHATVAQVGLFLIGIGLLTPDGLAGAGVWMVGDGLARACLFACTGMLQHAHDDLSERRLHGRGRDLPVAGAAFAVCAVLMSGLPPFGPFLGKSLVEDAAIAEGYDWVPAVMVVAGALVGGTLLRAAARVFLGIGRRAPEDPAGYEVTEGETEREAHEASTARSPLLRIPAVLLAAGAAAWGLVPGLAGAAGRAGAAMTDRAGYMAAVLDGAAARLPGPPDTLHGPGATGYALAVLTVLGAAGVAAAAIWRPWRDPAAGRRLLDALRAGDSGHPGDYAAWVAAGAAVLGVSFSAALL